MAQAGVLNIIILGMLQFRRSHDRHTTGADVENKAHPFASRGNVEGDVIGINRTVVVPYRIPGASARHFTNIASCCVKVEGQVVQPIADIGHESGRIGIVPALEIAHHRIAGSGIAYDIDAVHIGGEVPTSIAGAVVGVEGNFDRRAR